MFPIFIKPKVVTIQVKKIIGFPISPEDSEKIILQINQGKHKVYSPLFREFELKVDKSQEKIVVILLKLTDQLGKAKINIHSTLWKREEAVNSKIFIEDTCKIESLKKNKYEEGSIVFRIRVDETYSENEVGRRSSIFNKGNRRQSYVVSEIETVQQAAPPPKVSSQKRFSLFKNHQTPAQVSLGAQRSKAKSLANINVLEDSLECETDSVNSDHIPHDSVVASVSQDLGWVRVCDVATKQDPEQNLTHDGIDDVSFQDVDVDIWSVQPDYGPTTGNFTVIMEGQNFIKGLFDLTFVYIDGIIEPIDATNCTHILSDTELVLNMPPVQYPRTVMIHLELLDGRQITCDKKFHYTEPSNNNGPVVTPRIFEEESHQSHSNYHSTQIPPIFVFDNLPSSEDSGVLLRRQQRKMSDYESPGSIASDNPIDSARRSKTELEDEIINLKFQISELQNELHELDRQRSKEIELISRKLCNLEIRLLEDGLTKYLEVE